jgi:hypothetical protein
MRRVSAWAWDIMGSLVDNRVSAQLGPVMQVCCAAVQLHRQQQLGDSPSTSSTAPAAAALAPAPDTAAVYSASAALQQQQQHQPSCPLTFFSLPIVSSLCAIRSPTDHSAALVVACVSTGRFFSTRS